MAKHKNTNWTIEEIEFFHLDGNKLNNKIENLKVMTKEEHGSLHHRKHNYEYVKKLREAGLTLKQIANKIGTKSTGAVHYILNPNYKDGK